MGDITPKLSDLQAHPKLETTSSRQLNWTESLPGSSAVLTLPDSLAAQRVSFSGPYSLYMLGRDESNESFQLQELLELFTS